MTQMFDAVRRVGLVLTGSIASIKAVPLVEALQAMGWDVSVAASDTPVRWKWFDPDEVAVLSGHPVAMAEADQVAALAGCQDLLVAPASADFISQLAHGSSALARAVSALQARGGHLFVAPAMNYKMWQHPAVQRNIARLVDAGACVLGPVKGHMACGDDGFGRMMAVPDIIEAVWARLQGQPSDLHSLYIQAVSDGLAQVPFQAGGWPSVLVAIGGAAKDWAEIEALVCGAKKAGLQAAYVMDSRGAEWREALAGLTGQEVVVTDHFDIPAMEGMEHIKLPEQGAAVLFAFVDEVEAQAMLRGEGGSLCRDLYLASKVPVTILATASSPLCPTTVRSLRQDGVAFVPGLDDFASRKRAVMREPSCG